MKLNKNQLLRGLSILGFAYIVFLVVQFGIVYHKRGEVIANNPDVPAAFAREFNNIIHNNRESRMPQAAFTGPEGQFMTWQDLEGQYTLVNFWATWCPPCIVELPSLESLKKRYQGKGLDVIAISIDKQKSHAEILHFLTVRGIDDFAGYFDKNAAIQKAMPIPGIPVTYLLDPYGNILKIFEGDADWASRHSFAYFDSLIKPQDIIPPQEKS